jgi:hypothetical protein
MRSFRLETGRFFSPSRRFIPEVVAALPFALAGCWIGRVLTSVDLGNNDFAGAAYLMLCVLLLPPAVLLPIRAFVVGLMNQKQGRRIRSWINLIGSGCCAALIAGPWVIYALS